MLPGPEVDGTSHHRAHIAQFLVRMGTASEYRLKVAHVTATFPPYWGGTGNVAYHNARILHERGHEVTVFTATPVGREPMRFPFRVEYLKARFRLGNAPFTVGLVSRLKNFDLIHLHYPYIFGTELTELAARIHRTPMILTYHNRLQERDRIKHALFTLYNLSAEPLAFWSASRIAAVRRDHFIALHPELADDKRVCEIRNGVDATLFSPVPKRQARIAVGLCVDSPIALFVGALDQAHRFKNVEGLISALAGAQGDAHLVIVGDGGLRPSLQSLALDLGLEGRVHFLGAKSPEELPPIYSAADVCVLPSTEVESFGLVLIESLACGTPIIASDLPGVRDAVAPGIDGWRVPPGDQRSLTDALEAAFADPARSAAMGQEGRAKAVRNYSWDRMGELLESVYLEMIAEPRTSIARA